MLQAQPLVSNSAEKADTPLMFWVETWMYKTNVHLQEQCPTALERLRYPNRRFIYVLLEPHADIVRYVGCTKRPWVRWKGMLSELHGCIGPGRPVINWIRRRLAYNMVPRMRVVITSPSVPEAKLEESTWIREYSTFNVQHNLPELLNCHPHSTGIR